MRSYIVRKKGSNDNSVVVQGETANDAKTRAMMEYEHLKNLSYCDVEAVRVWVPRS